MSGVARGVAVLAALVVLLPVSGCSDVVRGHGAFVPGNQISPRLTTGPGPAVTPTPTPTRTPTPRNPITVARAVDVRASDLPGGWRQIVASPSGKDDLSWAIVCLRDAGVSPGTLSGAATPNFSRTGDAKSSQVGSATGLFPDAPAAARFLAGLRTPAVGRCMSAEANRTWPGSFSSGPSAFTLATVLAPAADQATGVQSTAQVPNGQRVTIQFFAIRTGPIVTVLDALWLGGPDGGLLAAVATRIAVRQHSV
ncbi:MAG: hypothetical protein V7637_4276 [Mycobacteriales bacterium]